MTVDAIPIKPDEVTGVSLVCDFCGCGLIDYPPVCPGCGCELDYRDLIIKESEEKCMICFCCGSDYDEKNRDPVVDLMEEHEGSDEDATVIHVTKIHYAGSTLKLCPACTRACAIGIALNSQNLQFMEDLEFEDDEPVADLSQGEPNNAQE